MLEQRRRRDRHHEECSGPTEPRVAAAARAYLQAQGKPQEDKAEGGVDLGVNRATQPAGQ